MGQLTEWFEELKKLVFDNDSRITVHLHEVGDRPVVPEALLAANACTKHVAELERKLGVLRRGWDNGTSLAGTSGAF